MYRRLKPRRRDSELYYATHYHLIPLYIICGCLIVTVLVFGCYLRYVYTSQQTEQKRQLIVATNDKIAQSYLPVLAGVSDNKQYIPAAAVRFTLKNPYQLLRYTFDAGTPAGPSGATLGISTDQILNAVRQHVQSAPPQAINVSSLAQCSRLYIIRFVPGSTPFGGYEPYKDIKLKDNRTTYIYKNSSCPVAAGDTAVADLGTTLQSVESY